MDCDIFFHIYITVSTHDEATAISRALLEKRLVSCANIFPAHQSMCWWQGILQEAQEIAVVYKVPSKNFKDIEKIIKGLHSYECPCIISLPIEQGSKDFLTWIGNEAVGTVK